MSCGTKLNARGVQVTQTLSSKFEEEYKLISTYQVNQMEQWFATGLDKLERCVQISRKSERPRNGIFQVVK